MRDAGCCWIFDIGYWILDSRQVVSSGMLLDTGPRIWRGRLLDIGFLITEIFFMTYKDLEIWKLAREVVIEVHDMTLKLPRFEMFEEGQQIRRSSKSVKATIEQKINAEQDAQKMQFVLQKEKQEAERKRVEAQGIADYQRIINIGLTDQQLQYEQIKAMKELAASPNAKIIMMGKSGTPVILDGKN